MIARIYRAAGWIGWFTLILMIGATAERYWSARDGHSASLAVSLLGALLLVVPPIRQTYRILPFKDVPQHEIPPQALEDPEVAAFIRDLQQKAGAQVRRVFLLGRIVLDAGCSAPGDRIRHG